MLTGVCKLCHRTKELCDSHYLPKAIYRQIRQEGGGDPIVMTPEFIVSSPLQVRDPVFCQECEERFNKGGETYVMSMVARANRFPLWDKLRGGPSFPAGPLRRMPGGYGGVKVNRLAHFAIGLLWKGAVHSWRTVARQTTKVRTLPNMEEVRRYLLNGTPMPAGMLVFVLLCLDRISQDNTNSPYLVGGFETEHRYEMLIKGIKFHVAFGRPQNEIDQLCCVHSSDHAIFAANCHDSTLGSVRHYHDKARRSKNLP